jgi:hypothetical protein
MVKVLLRLFGLLIVVGALFSAWFGFEALDNVRGLEMDVFSMGEEAARARGSKGGGKQFGPIQPRPEGKKMEGDPGKLKQKEGDPGKLKQKEGKQKQMGPKGRSEAELVAIIDKDKQDIEQQKKAGYLWFAAAVGALILGLSLLLLPSSRKRKVSAAVPATDPPEPLDNQPAPTGP